jgi:hypothetical protein
MSLSLHFTFSAPTKTSAAVLEDFLHDVEADALKIGFNPTLVLNVPFNTKERREFVRWFTTGLKLESEKLKGVVMLRDGQVWGHDPAQGFCFVIPEHGVLLTVTNEKGHETVFGFLRYPKSLKDLNGNAVVNTGAGKGWMYRNFVDSPDPRYRQIVKRFTDAGYTELEKDEFNAR